MKIKTVYGYFIEMFIFGQKIVQVQKEKLKIVQDLKSVLPTYLSLFFQNYY